MGSPFEYAEIMAAAFQFGTTDTVAEVVARHEAAHLQQEAEAARKRKSRLPGLAGVTPPPSAPKPIPKSSINELRELMEKTGLPVPAALKATS